MSEECQIITRLTGPVVDNGEIDINDYIEYLAGISELCKCVNAFLNPGTHLTVKVNYNIEKGSIINFLNFIIENQDLFVGLTPAYSMIDIMSCIGFIGDNLSLLKLLIFQKDKKLKGKIETPEGMKFVFEGTNSSEEIVEMSKVVAQMYENKDIRENVEKSTKILKKDGYQSIGFKQKQDNDFRYIDKKEASCFEYKKVVVRELSTVYEAIINMASIPTENLNNKWKFQEGNDNSYWALVTDEKFKKDVRENGIKPPFSIKAKIKKEQKFDDNGIQIELEKEIVEVLEFVTVPEQTKLC